MINAENYGAIFESVNHAMDRVAGVILWKTNPAWPSVIWQLYDWYLCPNAGYYFTKKACEPLHIQLNIDDYTSLSILPQVKLDVEIDKVETEEQVTCHIRMKNSSDTLAFFVKLSIRKGDDGEEVLPSFWSDNFFSILPGKTKELTVEFQRSKLEGTRAFMRMEGWNIVSQIIGIDK